MKREMSFDNAGWWIGVLVFLFAVLNIASYLVYVLSHPQEGFWEQIWGYAESEPPKLITAGLVLPLVIFLIEGNFDVTENVRRNRKERNQRLLDERNEMRLRTRELTSQMWLDLCTFADEVIYWDGKEPLENIMKRLSTFSIEAENTVYSWFVTLPCLRKGSQDVGDRDIEGFFLLFINALMDCVGSVAQFLRTKPSQAERDDLQNSLNAIKGGINSLCHYPFLKILESAAELEALRDPFAETDNFESTQERLRDSINSDFDQLKEWSHDIRAKINEEPLWPTERSAEFDSFRTLFEGAREWLANEENPETKLEEWDDKDELDSSFFEIPQKNRVSGPRIIHSKSWLLEFGALLTYPMIFDELTSRAEKW